MSEEKDAEWHYVPRKYRATAFDLIRASSAVSLRKVNHSTERIKKTSRSSRPVARDATSG
jgi:hypothetical protein